MACITSSTRRRSSITTSSSCRSGRWPATRFTPRSGADIRYWLLLGFAFGGALWAKYFVVVIAGPYALFLLFDREARPALRTPGPWLAMALALLLLQPHVVWLLQNDFVPFHYVDARSAPARGFFDHILHPVSLPAARSSFCCRTLFIAAMFVWPRPAALRSFRWEAVGAGDRETRRHAGGGDDRRPGADAFDRRIVTVLAFGPAAAMLALIAASGRGTVTMWGYPLWLFLGLWIVLCCRRLDRRAAAAPHRQRLGRRLHRVGACVHRPTTPCCR